MLEHYNFVSGRCCAVTHGSADTAGGVQQWHDHQASGLLDSVLLVLPTDTHNLQGHDVLSVSGLDRLWKHGVNQSLSVDQECNGQPLMPQGSEFLYGPAGQEGAMVYAEDGRGRVFDDVYGVWVDQGHGVVVSVQVPWIR